jgi:hypothetical protein
VLELGGCIDLHDPSEACLEDVGSCLVELRGL